MDVTLQQLWQEHIKTITSSVKQLSKEIEAIKQGVSIEQFHSENTQHQTKVVEQTKNTFISSLKGGISRCDASIQKLASDVTVVSLKSQKEAQLLQKASDEQQQKLEHIQNQANRLTQRLNERATAQNEQVEVIRGSSNQQLDLIDGRIKRMVEDLRQTVDRNRRWAESERSRMETQLMRVVEGNASTTKVKQTSFEDKIISRLDAMQSAVEECKKECAFCKEEMRGKSEKDDVKQRFGKLKVEFDDVLKRMKGEYRGGLDSVKGSVSSTNQLADAKIKLARDELSHQLNNVKRMMVLI